MSVFREPVAPVESVEEKSVEAQPSVSDNKIEPPATAIKDLIGGFIPFAR